MARQQNAAEEQELEEEQTPENGKNLSVCMTDETGFPKRIPTKTLQRNSSHSRCV